MPQYSKPVRCPWSGCSHEHTFKVTNGRRPIQQIGEDDRLWAVTPCEKCGRRFKYSDTVGDNAVLPVTE